MSTKALLPRRSDLYYYLQTASWPMLLLIIAVVFFAVNALFALGYYFDGGIENVHTGSYADMFFFSVQTMATIGYGKMEPYTLTSNILVSIQALVGLLALAMMTGLVFTKFSRPTARVRFSRNAVVSVRNGVQSMMFRMANLRGNRIVEAEIHVLLAWDDKTLEGERVRAFRDLETTRRRSAFFALTWTAVHPIDAASPLLGAEMDALAMRNAEIVVSIVGLDETLSQTVHARHSYRAEDIAWGARFADVLTIFPDGSREIDFTHFDEVEMLEQQQAAAAG
ncbi:MAG TPA: ion channel [Candidatus Binataceae bacterium]|nr:ion channel [Candidatus Binataceae bacterium]